MSHAGIDALIAAFYAGFDNREGRVADGAALIALFADGASVTRVSPAGVERWSPRDFVAPRVALLSGGYLSDFHEWEVDARTAVHGAIAQRTSIYRKAGVRGGIAFTGGGAKLIHLHRGADGWRIESLLWQDDPETPDGHGAQPASPSS